MAKKDGMKRQQGGVYARYYLGFQRKELGQWH